MSLTRSGVLQSSDAKGQNRVCHSLSFVFVAARTRCHLFLVGVTSTVGQCCLNLVARQDFSARLLTLNRRDRNLKLEICRKLASSSLENHVDFPLIARIRLQLDFRLANQNLS
ncbi:MAG: hypothetical protein OXC80_01280, partial [Gammaproteobacteria bacterium]|nr:hypothetical protein [Gammaproteobacteria bacterium]